MPLLHNYLQKVVDARQELPSEDEHLISGFCRECFNSSCKPIRSKLLKLCSINAKTLNTGIIKVDRSEQLSETTRKDSIEALKVWRENQKISLKVNGEKGRLVGLHREFFRKVGDLLKTKSSLTQRKLVVGLSGESKIGKSTILAEMIFGGLSCRSCLSKICGRKIGEDEDLFITKKLPKSAEPVKEPYFPVEACFMFDPSEDAENEARVALLSIAFQLNRSVHGVIIPMINEILSTEADLNVPELVGRINSMSLEDLYKELILDPIRNLEQNEVSQFISIVLDGLDELSLDENNELKRVIVENAKETPEHLGVFFSFRPFMKTIEADTNLQTNLNVDENEIQAMEKAGVSVTILKVEDLDNGVVIRRFARKMLESFIEFEGVKLKNWLDELVGLLFIRSGGLIGNLNFLHSCLQNNPQGDFSLDARQRVALLKNLLDVPYSMPDGFTGFNKKLTNLVSKAEASALFLPLVVAKTSSQMDFFIYAQHGSSILDRRSRGKSRSFEEVFSLMFPHISRLLIIGRGTKVDCLRSVAFLLDEVKQDIWRLLQEQFDVTLEERQEEERMLTNICMDCVDPKANCEWSYPFEALASHLYSLKDKDLMESLFLENFPFLFRSQMHESPMEALTKYYLPLVENKPSERMSMIIDALLKSTSALKQDHRRLKGQFLGRFSPDDREKLPELFSTLKISNEINRMSNGTNVKPAFELIPMTASLNRFNLPVVSSFKLEHETLKKTDSPLVQLISLHNGRVILLCYASCAVYIHLDKDTYGQYSLLRKPTMFLNGNLIDAFASDGFVAFLTTTEFIVEKVSCEGEESNRIVSVREFASHQLNAKIRIADRIGITVASKRISVFLALKGELLIFDGKLKAKEKKFNLISSMPLLALHDSSSKDLNLDIAPGEVAEMFEITTFQKYHGALLAGTITGQVFSLCLNIAKSNSKTHLKFHKNLLFSAHPPGMEAEGDPIVRLTAWRESSAGGGFMVATERGFIGRYSLQMKGSKSRPVVSLVHEIHSAKRKARGTLVNSEMWACLALGRDKVISRKGNKLLVEDSKSFVKFELPSHGWITNLIESNRSATRFLTVSEDGLIRLWDLSKLNVPIVAIPNNEAMKVARTEADAHSDDDESDEDDMDFFLNVNQDMDETNQVLEGVNASGSPDGSENPESDEEDESEIDDDDFFLGTTAAVAAIDTKKSLTSSLSSRRHGLSAKNRLKLTNVEVNVFSDFWHADWISAIEINEAKEVACIGYKDGRVAIFSLTFDFFAMRSERFPGTVLTEEDIQLIGVKQLDSEISDVKISSPGKYMVILTRSNIRIYALSRTGYKSNGNDVDHLSLLWSQRKESPLHTEISFSECTTFIKLHGLDESSVPSVILNVHDRMRVSAADAAHIVWEARPVVPPVVIDGNVVKRIDSDSDGFEKEDSRWIGFSMDGEDNILSSYSKTHEIAIVGQGHAVHFLKVSRLK